VAACMRRSTHFFWLTLSRNVPHLTVCCEASIAFACHADGAIHDEDGTTTRAIAHSQVLFSLAWLQAFGAKSVNRAGPRSTNVYRTMGASHEVCRPCFARYARQAATLSPTSPQPLLSRARFTWFSRRIISTYPDNGASSRRRSHLLSR